MTHPQCSCICHIW